MSIVVTSRKRSVSAVRAYADCAAAGTAPAASMAPARIRDRVLKDCYLSIGDVPRVGRGDGKGKGNQKRIERIQRIERIVPLVRKRFNERSPGKSWLPH